MSSDPPIEIRVATQYLEEQSEPEAERYVFAYRIRISNRGDAAAKLVRRHWVITDGNGKIQEVRGDGVVGEQPRIAPGEAFEYSSGAIIETPVGTMQGSYEMEHADGHHFDAPIEAFRLAVPGIIQ